MFRVEHDIEPIIKRKTSEYYPILNRRSDSIYFRSQYQPIRSRTRFLSLAASVDTWPLPLDHVDPYKSYKYFRYFTYHISWLRSVLPNWSHISLSMLLDSSNTHLDARQKTRSRSCRCGNVE